SWARPPRPGSRRSATSCSTEWSARPDRRTGPAAPTAVMASGPGGRGCTPAARPRVRPSPAAAAYRYVERFLASTWGMGCPCSAYTSMRWVSPAEHVDDPVAVADHCHVVVQADGTEGTGRAPLARVCGRWQRGVAARRAGTSGFTDATVTPRESSSLRVSWMFSAVLVAAVSVRTASAGTPWVMA